MLLLPTSAQNVQVGPVSKSGLSWLSDPKWLFTCQLQVLRWLQDPIPSVPSSLFSDMSPLILLTSLQLWWAPGCFLRPARPASAFQPCVGFASSTCIASSRILLTHSLTSFKTLRKCYLNIPQPTSAAF